MRKLFRKDKGYEKEFEIKFTKISQKIKRNFYEKNQQFKGRN